MCVVNLDGLIVLMCGNGLRMVVCYLFEKYVLIDVKVEIMKVIFDVKKVILFGFDILIY